MISLSLIGRLRRYLPGTMGPERRTSRSPFSGWPARTRSTVTYSHSWPASRTAPATYRGYGEMYGGTPKFEGSSTYPSRITTLIGRNPCRGGDKRASPAGRRRFGSHPGLGLAAPAADDDDQDDHEDREDQRDDDSGYSPRGSFGAVMGAPVSARPPRTT